MYHPNGLQSACRPLHLEKNTSGWSSKATQLLGLSYHLECNLDEVRMSAVTSRFVYVSRKRGNIVKSAEEGEFLSLKLSTQHLPDRPRKLPTYLISCYPLGADPSLSRELDGVYSARRFHHEGTSITKIVVTWTLPDSPPSSVEFSSLPSLPPCGQAFLL